MKQWVAAWKIQLVKMANRNKGTVMIELISVLCINLMCHLYCVNLFLFCDNFVVWVMMSVDITWRAYRNSENMYSNSVLEPEKCLMLWYVPFLVQFSISWYCHAGLPNHPYIYSCFMRNVFPFSALSQSAICTGQDLFFWEWLQTWTIEFFKMVVGSSMLKFRISETL